MQKILIVEDEETQRIALETFIAAWGYEVVAVDSATAAIVYLSQNSIDLAVVDLHLPDNPGMEILKHIRDTDDKIPVPVFMMSGEDSPEVRIVCMSTGADDFLPKPLNFADLSMKIQQAVSYTHLVHPADRQTRCNSRGLCCAGNQLQKTR